VGGAGDPGASRDEQERVDCPPWGRVDGLRIDRRCRPNRARVAGVRPRDRRGWASPVALKDRLPSIGKGRPRAGGAPFCYPGRGAAAIAASRPCLTI
jgi:hypothetical protein